MKNRVREYRESLKMTQDELANAMGTSLRNVQYIEKGERGIERWLDKLSEALKVDKFDLLKSSDYGMRDKDIGFNEAPRAVSQKIPVWGVVDAQDGERYAINTEDTPLEWINPLPVQEADKDAFALLVAGESMSPKYEPGYIVCVNTRKPAIKGKDCVVEMKDGSGLIKKYVGLDNDKYVVEQLNPPKKFTLKKADVRRIMPVVGVIYDK